MLHGDGDGQMGVPDLPSGKLIAKLRGGGEETGLANRMTREAIYSSIIHPQFPMAYCFTFSAPTSPVHYIIIGLQNKQNKMSIIPFFPLFFILRPRRSG